MDLASIWILSGARNKRNHSVPTDYEVLFSNPRAKGDGKKNLSLSPKHKSLFPAALAAMFLAQPNVGNAKLTDCNNTVGFVHCGTSRALLLEQGWLLGPSLLLAGGPVVALLALLGLNVGNHHGAFLLHGLGGPSSSKAEL